MKVLLAGASGVLGGKIARELTSAGHEVSGLGRGAKNTLRADLLDREAVLRAVEGSGFDAVVHAATALQVVESMMFGYGYGDHGDAKLTEADAPFGPQGANPWLERHVGALRTKEELAFGADGIEGVSLRFGLFYGAGATDTTVLPMLRRRALPVVPDKGRALAWVDVDDAARAALLALTNPGAAGHAYNITDDTPIGFGSHVREVAKAFGTPAPMAVPLWLLKPAPLAHTIMSTNLRLANHKARRDLGWAPTHAGCATALRALADRLAVAERSASPAA
jgi:nucleoside-diphosphate-sugar epimerase